MPLNPGRPNIGYNNLLRGMLKNSTMKAQADLKKMTPETGGWSLGVAKVINLDYEEFFVTLRTLTGVSQVFDRVPVPLTMPGAGARHFLGAMPEVGSMCVVGWIAQESQEPDQTRTPVIISWLVPGVFLGRDWALTSEFEQSEYDDDSPKDQDFLSGTHSRVRHKLRHIHPGNVVGSSAQGADLVLDESARLANRRGNEILLRDQDQALVATSIQQFHAIGGMRIYSGPVQRDALLLPAMCVSDGKVWDDMNQAVGGVPISDQDLPTNPDQPNGFYAPSKFFQRKALSKSEGYLSQAPNNYDSYLDPYEFLKRGGIIDDNGYVIDPETALSGGVYGGKQYYRVANLSRTNSATNADTPSLIEHRIEIPHTSDGRLPVTEQNSGIDVDRLLDRDPNLDGATSTNAPFLTYVWGSVVGNDPYTKKGRLGYGLPLRAVVFDQGNDVASPRIEPVNIPLDTDSFEPTPLKEHLATLFHLIPPIKEITTETFFGFNKQGQLKASIGGDKKENSIEAALTGGLKLSVGGKLELLLENDVKFGSSRVGAEVGIISDKGPVRIYGGGPIKTNEAAGERISGTGDGESDLPAVDIGSFTNMRIQAEKQLLLKSNTTNVNSTAISLVGHESVSINGTKQVNVTTESYQLTCSGSAQELFNGPKYLFPTNFPLHQRTYVSKYPGFVGEKVDYVLCDRKEMFWIAGNHETLVQIGNLNYQTLLGTWTAQAASNSLQITPGGISGVAAVGTVTLTATAGSATVSGLSSATLVATGGPANVRGTAGVNLSGPISGPDMGPILAGGSLEPFTNLPYSTWGIGAKNFNITP